MNARDGLVRSPLARPGASPRAPDLRDVEALVRERGLSLGLPLHVEAEAGSTNDLAKSAARDGAPHGSVWLAESQTAGRGRQGRVWSSPRGENLLFSVLLRPGGAMPLARLPELSLVVGLAVRDAAAKAVGDAAGRLRVKWPNDVVALEGDALAGATDGARPRWRKLAGVLLESQITGSGARAKVDALIVGVGLNVHTRSFPGELGSTATSLALLRAAGAPAEELSRAAVLVDVLEGLHRDVAFVAERGLGLVHARLTAADALRGQRVLAEGPTAYPSACPTWEGTCEGIDLEGKLLVRGDDGVLRRVSSGEVHLGSSGSR